MELDNGSRDQLGEHHQISTEIQIGSFHLYLLQIDIYHIGHYLESIKTDPEGKHDVRNRDLGMGYAVYGGYHKARVFEHKEHPDIIEKREYQEHFSLQTTKERIEPVHKNGHAIIYCQGTDYEYRILRLPPGIKYHASREKHEVLKPGGNEIVYYEEYRHEPE